MSDAVEILQSALVNAVETHPVLADELTGVFDGPPPRSAFPYVSINDGICGDWSTKTAMGREIRMGLTVWDDGESATRLHQLISHVEDAVAALPRDLPGWRIASIVFLRSFVARNAAGAWAGVVDYRIRMLSTA
ncbi:MAG TPA: DUF3168 domain-containing protein [Sphingorhabdus sp.]|jgi:hypothetical protein|uniref:DUF3168 domain-containing protein n=1 Tax=Sphingorhabdus sp. TaxID=1902408 RepID=UPI002BB25E68|nr:DUF3168 domain-containing protein [Sphingorhabdus sp.]HMT40527.1 DUF3168 domain-containing protein [Sphingorhabdus sp.]HMU21298.1 DUF3168 domain-containing protein [Sphingorhabdus sp.]